MAKLKIGARPTKGQMVRVVNAYREGYRRGGAKHPKGQRDWPADAFDGPQIDKLIADARLDVSFVAAPKDESTKDEGAKS